MFFDREAEKQCRSRSDFSLRNTDMGLHSLSICLIFWRDFSPSVVPFYSDFKVITATLEPCCEKTSLGGFNGYYTKWAVQPQKIARSLKFRIYKVEGMNYIYVVNYPVADLHLYFHICKKQVFSQCRSLNL